MENKKVIYSSLGVFTIIKLCPQYILPCLFISGLLISAYGILDMINQHSPR